MNRSARGAASASTEKGNQGRKATEPEKGNNSSAGRERLPQEWVAWSLRIRGHTTPAVKFPRCHAKPLRKATIPRVMDLSR